MSKKELAMGCFNEGVLCSQAVLMAFADECGITKEQALKMSSCFGTGMCKGEVCGACTGALIALSLMYGQTTKGDMHERQRANMLTRMMLDRFKEANGSYICNDLLGYDVSTTDGLNAAKESGLFKEFCPLKIGSAAEILEEIIRSEKEWDV